MPATVVAERIGWERGLTQLKVRVRELRSLYLPADPCQRTHYQPGELAQWDLWFPAVDIPVGFEQARRPPVIVGVSGYSRMLAARLIRREKPMTCSSVTSAASRTSAPARRTLSPSADAKHGQLLAQPGP
jgi:hypothetical protein